MEPDPAFHRAGTGLALLTCPCRPRIWERNAGQQVPDLGADRYARHAELRRVRPAATPLTASYVQEGLLFPWLIPIPSALRNRATGNPR